MVERWKFMFTNTMPARQHGTDQSEEQAFAGMELTDAELESVVGGVSGFGGVNPVMPSMPSASEMLNMLNTTLQNVPLLSIR